MLVLSRHSDEKIVFPTLGIALHVLRVQGNVVRLGIEAPPEVQILRGELAQTPGRQQPPPLSHALRNRLNGITLQLHLLQEQLAAGRPDDADRTLKQALAALEALEAAPPKERKPVERRRCRTLVVEDDTNERELLAGLLNLKGIECATAEDGEAALEYLAKNLRPDFVLLDMRMPRCDGPETLRRIREDPRYRGLKVFAISGSAPESVNVGSGEQGVDAWFSKPLNPRKLWEAMLESRNQPAESN